ncbi:MAG: hypothetical protein K0M50_02945 [Prolixibacteraceae bacterium]|nr:hypothetical protein [Prolixibacteraceae bacterium]
MKTFNSLKILTFVLLTFTFFACSKGDDSLETKIDEEKIVKLVINYSGDVNAYYESLACQATTYFSVSTINVTGTLWDKVDRYDVAAGQGTAVFSKLKNLDGATKTLETSQKVTALTWEASYGFVNVNDSGKSINVTVDVYVAGKKVTTKSYSITGDNPSFNELTIVSDYK